MPHLNDIQIRDPFVLPVPERGLYYLYVTADYTSWDEPGGGFDVYQSADLEHWEGPFSVFRPGPDMADASVFWAPEVFAVDSRYAMFASIGTKDRRGTYVLTADDPLGPMVLHSDGPITPADWLSIDGTLFFEGGRPWSVFVHEWWQVRDGEMCAVPLTPDLRRAEGPPVLLFRASEAPWADPATDLPGDYVTDGPYFHRTREGQLLMLWSSFAKGKYLAAIARSSSGSVLGPWVHDPVPLMEDDGGHAMLFNTFEGRLMLALHTQKAGWGQERALFLPVEERDGTLALVE